MKTVSEDELVEVGEQALEAFLGSDGVIDRASIRAIVRDAGPLFRAMACMVKHAVEQVSAVGVRTTTEADFLAARGRKDQGE